MKKLALIYILFPVLLFQLGCVKPSISNKSLGLEAKFSQVNKAILERDFVGAHMMLSELEESRSIRNNPTLMVHILLNEAYCLIGQKRYNDAIKVLNKFISAYPKNSKSYVLRAYIFKIIGKVDKSISDLKMAEKIAPSDPMIKYNLGCLYIEKSNFELAVKKFKQAINIQPDFKDAYINLAYSMFYLGKYKEAIGNLDKATLLDKNDPDIFFNIALAYEKLHDYDNAISFYSKATEIDPIFISGYINRGILFLSLGKNELACSDFKKACSLGECEKYNQLKDIMVCH